VLVTCALVWSYLPNIANLIAQWDSDPNYSYGYLVVPIGLAILWHRRERFHREMLRPRWWGFLPLLAVLGIRSLLFDWNEQYLEMMTLPLVLASLALALGGWPLLRFALPAIGFLFFMYPLPPSVNFILAEPLQRVATWGSVQALQLLRVPVINEGNVIIVGAEPLEVARACNGLSMLLSFITLISAYVILVERPLWERMILLISAIPIALISNIIRIVATALCYFYLGHDRGEKIAHDPAGWAMAGIALVLVWLESRLLSWLFVPEQEEQRPAVVGIRRAAARPSKPQGSPKASGS
jgi:exosortase